MKSQDVVVALKVLTQRNKPWTQNGLAHQLYLSPSELNGALKRLVNSRLFQREGKAYKPRPTAITEFIIHGAKYVFPVRLGEPTRGIATAYAGPDMASLFSYSEDVPVWPHPEGKQRGYTLAPLHKCVPQAALGDANLHALLALVDAFRLGRAREAKKAEELWRRRVGPI